MSVEQKVILICGGGSGIGLATGRILSSSGAYVILLGRSEQKLLDAQRTVKKASIAVGDISKREQVESLAQRLVEENRLPHIIINCAGVHASARAFKDIIPQDWDYILGVNTSGVFNLLHSFVPAMRSRGSGHFINVSSVAASRPSILAGAAYTASKHAVNGLIRTVSLEEMKNGLRFSTVSPGPTDTPLVNTRAVLPTTSEREKMLAADTVASGIVWVASLPERAFVEELIIRPVEL